MFPAHWRNQRFFGAARLVISQRSPYNSLQGLCCFFLGNCSHENKGMEQHRLGFEFIVSNEISLSHYSLLDTVDGRNPAPADRLIGSLSHYLHGVIHPRWCRISSTNSMFDFITEWLLVNEFSVMTADLQMELLLLWLHAMCLTYTSAPSTWNTIFLVEVWFRWSCFSSRCFFWFPWLIFGG